MYVKHTAQTSVIEKTLNRLNLHFFKMHLCIGNKFIQHGFYRPCVVVLSDSILDYGVCQ